MDKENRRNNYWRNTNCGEKNSKSKRTTTETTVTEDKSREIQDKHQEFLNYEDDHTQLRECLLNKLWDSLPPEAQILSNSQSDTLDSDRTESGLDQGDDDDDDDDNNDEKENEGQRQTSESSSPSTCNSPQESSFCQAEDPKTLWEVNFDFIQAIIWLKSAVAKLQRIPASEVCQVFKNQWRLSRKITFNHLAKCEAKASKTVTASTSSTFRRPLTPINRELSLPHQENTKYTDTKLHERLELLKRRLRNSFDELPEDLGVHLIADSEPASVSSMNSQSHFPEIRGSETTERRSHFDSGFNSEKAESLDMVNASNTAEKIESRATIEMEMSNRNLPTVMRPREANLVQLAWKNPSEVSVSQTGRTISNKRSHGGISVASLKSKISKRSMPSVSSATLKYLLRGSECNQLLFRSVKAILNVLKKEESASSFTEWHGSLHKEAIEAIVSAVVQLDEEKGPDICRREVVGTIEEVLKKMLRSNELDKNTIWEHHRSVVLELCNVFSVCTAVIDYLIGELKKLISVATQNGGNNSRESVSSLQKSPIIFHSLNTVLGKYKALVPSSVNADVEEPLQKIPEVTELWKRDSKITRRAPDIFVAGLPKPKNQKDCEKIWIEVLEKLSVACTKDWPLVTVSAWECLSILKTCDG